MCPIRTWMIGWTGNVLGGVGGSLTLCLYTRWGGYQEGGRDNRRRGFSATVSGVEDTDDRLRIARRGERENRVWANQVTDNTKSDRINQMVLKELLVFMSYELRVFSIIKWLYNYSFFLSFLCVESWFCGDWVQHRICCGQHFTFISLFILVRAELKTLGSFKIFQTCSFRYGANLKWAFNELDISLGQVAWFFLIPIWLPLQGCRHHSSVCSISLSTKSSAFRCFARLCFCSKYLWPFFPFLIICN